MIHDRGYIILIVSVHMYEVIDHYKLEYFHVFNLHVTVSISGAPQNRWFFFMNKSQFEMDDLI